jgi:FMN phosphatase YigB (HAD superfamily)
VARAIRHGVGSFLANAARDGFLLGIVSDYPATRKLDAMGMLRFFDVVVTAQQADVGCFKPYPAGIHAALRQLEVEPHDAVYVGDRPDVDAAAAVNAGVQAVVLGRAAPRRGKDAAGVFDFHGLGARFLPQGNA